MLTVNVNSVNFAKRRMINCKDNQGINVSGFADLIAGFRSGKSFIYISKFIKKRYTNDTALELVKMSKIMVYFEKNPIALFSGPFSRFFTLFQFLIKI